MKILSSDFYYLSFLALKYILSTHQSCRFYFVQLFTRILDFLSYFLSGYLLGL